MINQSKGLYSVMKAEDSIYVLIKSFSLGFPKNREKIIEYSLKTESNTVVS